jgi:hypothetical protein
MLQIAKNGGQPMKWHEKWQAIVTTYPMPESQVNFWLEEIREKTGGATEGECLAAVERVAERKRMGKIGDHPNCGDIVAAIWFARKQKSPAKESRLKRFASLKLEMAQSMPDKNETWNIICRCDDIEMIRRAEAYARHELEFTRPTMREMDCKPVAGLTSGLINNVADDVKTRDKGR